MRYYFFTTIAVLCSVVLRVSSQVPVTSERDISDWIYRMVGEEDWRYIQTPSTILEGYYRHSTPFENNHPYFGKNEQEVNWVSENDWEFQTLLNLDNELISKGYQFEIEFQQLDLFADVYLNHELWFSHNNSFLPITKKIPRKYLKSQINLKIIFHSTVDSLKNIASKNSVELPGGDRVYARKPQYEFGWDWGPTIIQMGIRQAVVLRTIPPKTAKITGLNFIQKNILSRNSSLTVGVEGHSNYDSLDMYLTVYLDDHIISTVKQTGSLDNFSYTMENPQLWWPNGVRNHSTYYQFSLKLTLPGDTQTLDKKHVYYAVCDIDLIQQRDVYGKSFYFKVNNKKVFAKGANYIPEDSFNPGDVLHFVDLIRLAQGCNMNMLRVWGGGVYPMEDWFYIWAMKNRIMIWQDFMFACAMYPGTAEFRDNVVKEATYHVNRLKNYRNIAVWCGNNENDEGWKNWGWQSQYKYTSQDSISIWKNYLQLFHKDLPKIVDSIDPEANYIASSPQYGWGRKKSMKKGDSHYWGVWWGLEPIDKLKEKVPRFMSEYGMQSFPDITTLKTVVPDSLLNLHSDLFKNHQKHPTGFENLDHYLKEYFTIPAQLEDYGYATQVLQSYTLTTGVLAQRLSNSKCMGSLIWQLNDCWPGISWSLIDYYKNPKIAYYEVSQVFEPVLIAVKETKHFYKIFIINDRPTRGFRTQLIMFISDFYGKKVWEKSLDVRVTKKKQKLVYAIPKKRLSHLDLSTVFMHLYFHNPIAYDKSHETFFHFVKPNELKLPPPDIFITHRDTSSPWFYVKNESYSPYVYLPGNTQDDEMRYLGHLLPNESTRIYVTKSHQAWVYQFIENPKKIKSLNLILNP